MVRRVGVTVPQKHRHGDGQAFVCSVWSGWFIQLVLQCIVQPSIIPGATATGAPPTLVAFAFGMNFMPAFLASKSQSLLDVIRPDYYDYDYDDDVSYDTVDVMRAPPPSTATAATPPRDRVVGWGEFH